MSDLKPVWSRFVQAWREPEDRDALCTAARAVLDHRKATPFARTEAHTALAAAAFDDGDFQAARMEVRDAMTAAQDIPWTYARGRALSRLLLMAGTVGRSVEDDDKALVQQLTGALQAAAVARQEQRKEAVRHLAEAGALHAMLEEVPEKRRKAVHKEAVAAARRAFEAYYGALDRDGMKVAASLLGALESPS